MCKKPRNGAETSRYEYLHRDHLGSASAVTGADRTISRQAAHDPFGGRRKTDWTRELTDAERAAWADGAEEHSTQGFAAHGQLDRAGLVDMGGRLYDPRLGLFLSPDPAVARPHSTQGWNPYSYVGNRPMSRVDPDGFQFAEAGCNLGGVLCPGGGLGGALPGGSSAAATLATSTTFRLLYRLYVSWRWVWSSGFGRGMAWDGDYGANAGIGWGVGLGAMRLYPMLVFVPHLDVDVDTESVHFDVDWHPGDAPLYWGRLAVSVGIGLLPGVGSVQSAIELVTGRDYITGEAVHRGWAAVGIFAGVLPGGRAAVTLGTRVAPRAASAASAAARRLRANSTRGLAAETRILKMLGISKNTRRVYAEEGYSIPDGLTDEALIEIKNVRSIYMTRQVRIQTKAAKDMGIKSYLYVGTNTHVGKAVEEAYYRVTRLPELDAP